MKKYKILLVDDDPVLIKGTSLYLEQKGYRIFIANNGKMAIELLQDSFFDLVLTDLVMPEIDGFHVLEKAKKLYPQIMVMVMTGFGDIKFAIDCLRLGADDYMLKPCEPEEMLFRIKNCFEKLETKKTIKKSEVALKNSEKLYRSLIETTGVGYVVFDASGKIKDASKECLRLIGKKHPDEIMGRDISEWTAEHDRVKFAKGIQTCLDQGFIRNFEFDVIDDHGKITSIEVQATLVETKKGRDIIALSKDITDRKKAHDILEQKVKQRTIELTQMNEQLEVKRSNLKETNIALNILLEKRDKDKIKLEQTILFNVKQTLAPCLERIKGSQLDDRQKLMVDLLESNLNNIISPFLNNLSSIYSNLTPKEIQIARLIKEGRTTKEIAQLLISSVNTIEFHRKNIRKKLGINNTKKINLQSHLLSLPIR